jgi:hypothetical protein
MNGDREQLRQRQRKAIWRWRWLGLRGSTPGFKASLIVLAAIVVYVAVRAFTAL